MARSNLGFRSDGAIQLAGHALAVVMTCVLLILCLHTIGIVSLQSLRLQITAIGPETGHAYSADISSLQIVPGSGRAARAELLEDGRPLLRPNQLHADIREQGLGRFSVWGATLYFSTSDNSDPRTNGRSYSIVGPAPIPVIVIVVVVLLLGLGLFPDRRRIFSSLRTCLVDGAAIPALIVALLLCWWKPWSDILRGPILTRDWPILMFFVAVGAIALALPYRSVPPHVRTVCIGLSVLFGCYAFSLGIWSWTDLSPREIPLHSGVFLSHSLWLGPLCVFITCRYPLFAIAPIVLVAFVKQARVELVGVPFTSHVDVVPVAEVGIFICSGVVLAFIYCLAANRMGRRPDFAALTAHLIVFALAVHFSNYFSSALAKAELPGGALVWIRDNPTFWLAAHSADIGAFPLGGLDWLHSKTVIVFKNFVVFGNLVTFMSQCVSVIAPISLPFSAFLSLFFDLWHVVVLATTGIFFWKWIVLNATLFVSIRSIAPGIVSRPYLFLMPLVVFLAPRSFDVARLGWFDTRALNKLIVLAEMRDGTRVRVPSNFFGAHSFEAFANFGLLSAGHPIQARAFPTHIYGTTTVLADLHLAQHCSATVEDSIKSLPGTPDLIRMTHSRALRSGWYRYAYDLQAHHVWSNPFSFSPFRQINLSDVTGYVFRLEARCGEIVDGRVHSRTIMDKEIFIPLVF